MKKFLSFTVLAAAALQFAPMASAQEADVEIIPPANDIYTHDWKTNWYIQLGAGAQVPLFERNGYDSTFESNKITAVYEVGVGSELTMWAYVPTEAWNTISSTGCSVTVTLYLN